MNVYFLLPLLLVIFIFIPSDNAFAERGKNFDKEILGVNPDGTISVKHTLLSYERIHDGTEWKDYIYRDLGNALEIKTANNIVRLDVTTCGFSFHNANGVLLFNDSIVAFSSIVNQYTWSEVTQVNNAACEAYYDVSENSLVAKRYAVGVGFMEYKYIFDQGLWKTQLEATNLTAFTNRVFAFDQTIDLNRDTINFGGQQRNLDNFNGQTFGRTWLENNKAKVIDFLNGVNFDFDLGFDYLDSVTMTDTGANKSKLTFHYMRNNVVLMPNETLIIDPTYTNNAPTDGFVEDVSGDNVCSTSDGGKYDTTQLIVKTYATGDVGECDLSYLEYDITSIPTNALVTDSDFAFDTVSIVTPYNCVFVSMGTTQTSATGQQIMDAILGGTTMVTDSACTTTGDNKSVDLGATGDTQIQNRVTAGSGFFSMGIKPSTIVLDGSAHTVIIASTSDAGAVPKPTLTIVYTTTPRPDAVDDLTSPSQSYGSVDLLWTQPELNGETCEGYQINYTTPQGNPLTIITNNTGSCTTSTTVSNLDIATPYTFGVSVWTAGGNNATKPPMVWLNVTTQGNFTIGSATFNQTNTQVLPITFEEQAINSTAKFLNVTFANTYTLACDFAYKFANNNHTYTNLSSYAVSSTLNETYFEVENFDNEIIDVNCYDTITGEDAQYLMVQSDFPLLEQIDNFRNGTYGTEGKFGVFDFVTIAVVIFSMVGLNRVNESVGAIFNVILLGSLAYFGIIELPTVIFGFLTVVVVFVITSTRKD